MSVGQQGASPAPALASGGLSHLVAALAAGGLFLVGLLVVSRCADVVIARHIYGLAGSQYPQKSFGLAVQREALLHDDLLPLYGSSEVDRDSANHPRQLFATAPTGFTAFTVGKRGAPLVSTVQNIAALGRDLRGKKVAVLLSPPMFETAANADQYDGNFSPLHALTVLVNPDLSRGLKQRMALRLLEHPSPLDRNKVLALTTRVLADERPSRRALSTAILPLALLQQRLLAAEDKLLMLEYLLGGQARLREPRQVQARVLDWQTLAADATARYGPNAAGNSFGVDRAWWVRWSRWVEEQPHQRNEETFARGIRASGSWDDLENLLQSLQELGAKPLIFSMPFHGPFYDSLGISASARGLFYTGVREMAARYGTPAAVLDDHESDHYLFIDLWGHISPVGWIYCDQILDAFYHDPRR